MNNYKTLILSVVLLAIASCTDAPETKEKISEEPKSNKQEAFKNILEHTGAQGAVLIYDLKKNIYYSNDYDWASQGQLPASTFKIVNSIIGLETGVITDSVIFKWDGEQKWNEKWMQDLTLDEAIEHSCVPCYQELAKKIGADRMNEYLDKYEYPKMAVDSSTIDMFWLEGESRINQFQQIDFLVRFHQNKLPISKETSKKLREILILDESDGVTLSGKTGLSITDGMYNGWFVGYLEKGDELYFFATNIEKEITEEDDFKPFFEMRKLFTHEAFRERKIME
ncbi:MAG: beta-lactamase class D [Salibacteraceae bacterium]|jgi:beta-lactamase class D